MGDPQNGWFMMETSIRIDDLRVPALPGNLHILYLMVFI